MKQTALILGLLIGAICLVWNITMQHDWLVAVSRAGTVAAITTMVFLYSMRGVAHVLIAQLRAQNQRRQEPTDE